MNYTTMAQKLIAAVGGAENITYVTHCATRVRFNLKHRKKVNVEDVKAIEGVYGVIYKAGQFQIIIGNDVSHLYQKIIDLGGLQYIEQIDENLDRPFFDRILDTISGIFSPILPVLVGTGMVKAILVLLIRTGVLNELDQTYYMLNLISDAGFYFLPIFLANSAAKKFKINPYIAMMIAGALLHPDFTVLIDQTAEMSFFGFPVTLATYSSSVIPILLSIWFMSHVERFADWISPTPMKFFLKPIITILIVAPMTFIVLGPMGTIIGDYLAKFIDYLSFHLGWAVTVIIGALSPLLVMTGMHYSLVPLTVSSLVQNGYDMILSPSMLVSNIAQGGAAIAVALKTKNSQMKQLGFSAGFTAVLGITEPAMYGITLKLKRPLIAVIISGGLAGIYAGLTGVAGYSSAIPGLAALPIFISDLHPDNFMHAVIAAALAFILSFCLTYFWAFKGDDSAVTDSNSNDAKETTLSNEHLTHGIQIRSPLSGAIVPLAEVGDQTFSNLVLGKGIALVPSEGAVYAPFDGKVAALFKTNHAIALESDEGVKLLIHVGMNTVKLDGLYFEPKVQKGDVFKCGDLLMTFDIDRIRQADFEMLTPIVVTNTDQYLEVIADETAGNAVAGQPIIAVL